MNNRLRVPWIALVLLATVGCAGTRSGDPSRTLPFLAGDPNLVLEHIESGAWVTINNHPGPCDPTAHGYDPALCAGLHHPDHDGQGKRSHLWTGLLMQLGTFDDLAWGYDSVNIFTDSSVPALTIRRSDNNFEWINIVSNRMQLDSRGDPAYCTMPISSVEAFQLFTNRMDEDESTGLVAKLNAAYKDNVLGSAVKPTKELERGRQLHPDMKSVRCMLTYWQGDDGFTARSTQPVVAADRRWDFWFPNAFTVTVSRLVLADKDVGNGQTEPDDRLEAYETFDNVSQIVVYGDDPGPSDMHTQPPPWWWP